MNTIVIIGAGEAGVCAALTLREQGFEGTIQLAGAEKDLPYERPPLSKRANVEHRPIMTALAFDDARIELIAGETARSIDTTAQSVVLDGRCLAYDRLLIATGARPRPIGSLESALSLRTLADAQAIFDRIAAGKHVVIIGGGLIGLELAATARQTGAMVTVVEAESRLMARAIPADIAAVIETRHREAGVAILLGARVVSSGRDRIDLADGRRIDCDLAIAAIGIVPETDLARSAGLDIENGIVVDARFQTSQPDVFAAGDCCAFPYRGRRVRLESWRGARDQGEHAARAMLGDQTAYRKVPWFWSDHYDLGLQTAGLLNENRPFIRRDLGDSGFLLFQLDEEGALSSASGIGPGNAVARDIRLAEMMIERKTAVSRAELTDPDVGLKALLRNG